MSLLMVAAILDKERQIQKNWEAKDMQEIINDLPGQMQVVEQTRSQLSPEDLTKI